MATILLPVAGASGASGDRDLRVMTVTGPSSLDPHRAYTGADFQLLGHIFDPFLSRDLFAPVPGLLAGWQSVDQRIWRLQPASGRQFSDGRPVTGRDLLYSLCRWATINRAAHHGQPVNLKRASLNADGTEILVELEEPQVRLTSALLLIYGVQAPDGFRENSCTSALPATMVRLSAPQRGSGPYKLRHSKLGNKASFTLEAVTNSRGQRSAPFDRVHITTEPDAQQRVRALANGQADIIEDPPPAPLAYLPNLPQISLTELPTDRTLFLSINLTPHGPADPSGSRSKALADVRVRQAIALLIDKTLLAQRATDGYGSPAHQIALPGMRGSLPARPDDTSDPAKARDLLREAGYAEGLDLELLAPPQRGSDGGRTADILAGMLSVAGIRVTVIRLDRDDYRDRLREGRFDLALNMLGIEDGLIMSAFQGMLSPQAVRSILNPGLYKNAAITRMLTEAAADPSKMDMLTGEIQTILDRDIPFIPLLHMRDLVLHRSDLTLNARDTGRVFGRIATQRASALVR
ncbi:ABC transporter substrate-binding protein [Niveispirillum lacus]|nr:ABC transporter substrate-binding protein [Niveispirillum lacus]